MSNDQLLVQREGAIALVTFNNPKALNALTVETFMLLETLLKELAEDDSVHALILTGSGEKAFIAG